MICGTRASSICKMARLHGAVGRSNVISTWSPFISCYYTLAKANHPCTRILEMAYIDKDSTTKINAVLRARGLPTLEERAKRL